MATRKFKTKDGKTVEFSTGGRKGGRAKANGATEDAGAEDRREADGAGSGAAETGAGEEGRAETGAGAETDPNPGGYPDQGGESAGGEGAGEDGTRAGEIPERRDASAPRTVEWRDVAGDRDHAPPPPSSLSAALGQLAGFVFQVPAAMGLGQHWPLDPREERNWGKSLEGCLKALPQKSKKAAVTAISRWIPWVSLSMTAYMTIMPRVMTSGLGRGVRRESNSESTGSAPGSGRAVRGQGASPNGEYGGFPSWEDYRGHGG